MPDFMNGDDVGVVESGSGAGFLFESAEAVFVGGEARGEQLESHPAAEASVLSEIYLTHPAAPDLADDLVRANCLPHFGWELLGREQVGGHLEGGPVNQAVRLLVFIK